MYRRFHKLPNWQQRLSMTHEQLPPGQQLAAPGKWPVVGEREPAPRQGDWDIQVSGLVEFPRRWSLEELSALPQETRTIDVHCVTRWSILGASFTGVPLERLLAASRLQPDGKFVSFVAHSARSHSTSLSLSDALELGCLITLRFDGQPISIEHGGPIRIVTPGRYFYKSLKWLARIEILAEDRLGYWEGFAGYHNRADPWLEERFIASGISKQEAAKLFADKNISGMELLGLDGSDRDLRELQARGSILRNANFQRAQLQGSDFTDANLSGSRLMHADLRNALLVRADLEGANLSGSDLRGADLRGASLFGVSFVEDSPAGTEATAIFDEKTRIDASALDQPMPRQAEFLARFLSRP
jgi:DMSO/TMAO reductase YedYZ molybdopterin-dependent catalytic subunit